MESPPKFIHIACVLYEKDLKNKKANLVIERNNTVYRYQNWLKGSYEHFRMHNQNNSINDDELSTLCDVIKEYIYKKYDPEFKELDAKINEVSSYILQIDSIKEEN